jgi:hypothetical protein
VVIKAKRLLAGLGFLALEVGLSVRDTSSTLVHLLTDLLHETLPQLLFLLAALAHLADGGIDPLRKTAQEWHEVGDGAGRRDLGNEFTRVLAVSSRRFGGSVAKTSRDTTTESIGEREVILGIGEKLVHEALGLVGDVAVVFGVEAGGQDGVSELALIAPVVCGMR